MPDSLPHTSTFRIQALERLARATGADAVLSWSVVDDDGITRVVDPLTAGDGRAALLQRARTVDGRAWTRLVPSPDGVDPVPFVDELVRADRSTVRDLAELEGTALVDEVLRPSGARWCLSLARVERDRVVGVVLLLRAASTGPFSRSVQRNRSLEAPRATFATPDLDAPTSLLLDGDGEVLASGGPARTWSMALRHHEVLGEAARDVATTGLVRAVWVGRCRARLEKLTGTDGVLVIAHLEPKASPAVSPVVRLTPTQRRVAEYAVAGATAQEIARSLECGTETVRSHLREIYRRLDVASRLELAACFR